MASYSEILADLPVAYWPLDGSLNDESGNGHHLTLTAGAYEWQYGMLWGGAFATTATLGTGDWTIRATVNIGYYTGRGGWVVGDGTAYPLLTVPTGAGLAWIRDMGLGQPWDGLYTSGGTTSHPGGADWQPPAYYSPIENRLVEAVAICTGGTVELWIDGALVGSGPGDSATGSPLVLEDWDVGTGARGQIAVFDYALSPFRANVHTYGAPELPESVQTVADAMQADGADGVWTVPTGDGDAVADQTGVSGDASLSSGVGFTSPVADEDFGFSLAGGDWGLGVTPDATTFTIEFLFRANGSGVSPVVLSDGGDIYVTAVGSMGTTTYAATIGADTVTWSTAQDSRAHLVAVTWDATGTELTLVVDGVVRDTVNPTSGAIIPADLTVSSSDSTQQVGTIAVYDSVLTPAQILDHYLLLAPRLLPAAVIDDFDRANGTLGNSSLQSLPWSLTAGTGAIASNEATATRIAYLPDTHGADPTGLIRGVEAVVTDGGAGGVAAIGLWSANYGSFRGAYVDFGAGTVDIGETEGIDGSWYLAGLSTAVDLSAGSALVRFQLDETGDPIPFGPAIPSRSLSVWVDGVPVIVAPALVSDGAVNPAAVAFGTVGGTIEYLAVLEPDGLGQDAQDAQVGGLEFRFWPFDGVLLGSSTQGPQVGGLAPPGDPIRDSRPVFLGASPTVPQRGGIRAIWTNGTVPAPAPNTPPVWAGVGSPPADLAVDGFPLRTEASCRPTLNGAGSGAFTTPGPGPALGDVVTLSSGGSAVFTGYADEITEVVAAQDEEAGQLVSVGLKDLLSIDWTETIVWPDFGAFDPIRVGAPPQDDREWGWPMNGLVDEDNVASLVPSVANDPTLYGTPNEVLPIPDNWPDSTARWMWDTSPDTPSQPQGWVYFRVPFGSWPGRYACFLNAWDYAKMWIDGALIAEVTTPGQTVRFDVDFDWDFHLLAIAAYNEGGPAGVMCSVMQHHADGSGLAQPAMNSRGGWKCLAYPERTLRGSTGKVLRTLVREAAARGAPAGAWACAFTDEADSNGEAWPDDESMVVTKTGQTMFDVLNMMAEDRYDFAASPAGRTLYVYRKGKGAGAVSQPWAVGVHAESLATRTSGR